MYTIYVNESKLVLVSTELAPPISATEDLVMPYPGTPNALFPYIDSLEKKSRFNSITLFASDVEQLKADFFSRIKIKEAAGGVVRETEQGHILAIYRRGSWDLPKGKRDEGETLEQTAMREVEEETGVQHLQLGKFLLETYHLYRNQQRERELKLTRWYEMTAPRQELTPQAEENIEKADWIALEDLRQRRPMYSNILDVLDKVE